jgi:hypothetical protein
MFSAFEEQERIGAIIRDSAVSLLRSRSKFSERFSDTDEKGGINGLTGAYASMQGLRAVFGAAVAIDDQRLWDEISTALPSLLAEWESVIEEFRAGVYGVAPYYADTKTFTQVTDSSPYVDTISWAISTAVLINFVGTQCSEKLQSRFPHDLLGRTRDEIVRALQLLVKAQAEDGGWSWSAAYRKGHPYFTWSASEGLADFFDYVVGESVRELGISEDIETLDHVKLKDDTLLSSLSEARTKCRDYLTTQLDRAFTKRDWEREDLIEREKVGTVTFVRLAPTDDSSTPVHFFYFDLYLLESLILNNYDYTVDLSSIDEDNRQRLGRLYQKIASKLPEILAAARTEEFNSNPGASTLRMVLSPKQAGRGRATPLDIQDPGLWPQLLRTLVLYRFYPAPSAIPDKAIVGEGEGALDLVLQDRRAPGNAIGDGLWDQFNFNLSVTARSIEGLIDVFDYCGLLVKLSFPVERPKQEPTRPADPIAALAEALFPHIAAKLEQQAPSPSRPSEILSADQLNARIFEKVAEIFSSLEEPLDREDGGAPISVANVVTKLIGKKRAEDLADDSDARFALLRSIAWISYNTTVQMLEWIIQEGAIRQLGDVARANRYRSNESSDERMAERLALGLKALVDTEERSHGIDYKRSIERIFTETVGKV